MGEPVRTLPESPHEELIELGAAEDEGQDIAGVVGLERLVEGVGVKLGDGELKA